MIRNIILVFAALCGTFCAGAQMKTTRTITGMVVDKNGNPLSGAEVRAEGGAETVYTNADGSYSIEVPVTLKKLTASYTGLRDQKLSTTASPNVIFTLKPIKRTRGFVNLVGGASKVLGGEMTVDGMIPQAGVMGGAYRSWGGYFKIVMGFLGPEIYDSYGYGEHFGQMPLMTGGVIKRISQNFNILVGAGAGVNYNPYVSSYEYINSPKDSYYNAYPENSWAVAGEIAFMYVHRKINIIAGVTYVSPCFEKDNYGYTSGGPNDSYWCYYKSFSGDNNGNLNFFLSFGLTI